MSTTIKTNRNRDIDVHLITLTLPNGLEVGNYITTAVWLTGFIGWIEAQPETMDGEWTLRLFFDADNDSAEPPAALVKLAERGEITNSKLRISYTFEDYTINPQA